MLCGVRGCCVCFARCVLDVLSCVYVYVYMLCVCAWVRVSVCLCIATHLNRNPAPHFFVHNDHPPKTLRLRQSGVFAPAPAFPPAPAFAFTLHGAELHVRDWERSAEEGSAGGW